MISTNDIPAWFWDTRHHPTDETLHVGPDLEEQRWVSNGHVMLRVQPAKEGDDPIVRHLEEGEQEPLEYVRLVRRASMMKIISKKSESAPRLCSNARMRPGSSGELPDDFFCKIGDRAFCVRYVAWIELCYANWLDGFKWTQSDNEPAYAFINAGITNGTLVAVIQCLASEGQEKKLGVNESSNFDVVTNRPHFGNAPTMGEEARFVHVALTEERHY